MLREIMHKTVVKKVIAPISGAGSDAAIVGASIDHQGFESANYEIQTGVLSDADATFTPLLEESDDDSTYTAVADKDMVSQTDGTAPETAAAFNFGDDGEVRRLGYIGTKRYTRLTLTPATNTGAWLISAICILGSPRQAPPTQPAS